METPDHMRIATSLGYIDARTCVLMHQTYGLPVEMALDKAAEHGLRPDWQGLRAEFCLQLGMEFDDAERRIASIRKEYEMSH